MNVLVTGAKGFIGRNLVLALRRSGGLDVLEYDLDSPPGSLESALGAAGAVFHLAGVNRPRDAGELQRGNVELTADICGILRRLGRKPLLVFSSSTQASFDNPYGSSKRAAEGIISSFVAEAGSRAVVFRLPGVFGKWSRPDYNSVVATFCHRISRGIPIEIADPETEIELVYIDDVVAGFLGLLGEGPGGVTFGEIAPRFRVRLGELARKLFDLKESRSTLKLSDLSDPFLRRLCATYLSYLPADQFSYSLEKASDPRGSLAEVLKAGGHGEIFVSRTKPGATRGNHYHDSRIEKFLVLEGQALIRFRNLATGEQAEYPIDGGDWKVVDVPPGWTHSIRNVGTSEMIVLVWSSEVFEPSRPDTFPAEV